LILSFVSIAISAFSLNSSGMAPGKAIAPSNTVLFPIAFIVIRSFCEILSLLTIILFPAVLIVLFAISLMSLIETASAPAAYNSLTIGSNSNSFIRPTGLVGNNLGVIYIIIP